MKADFVIQNANIITMSKELPHCSWVAVYSGKIVGLGECDDECMEAEIIVDAEGRTVLPGLSDCHVHVLVAGLHLNAVHLETAKDLDEVLGKIEEACLESKGDWVFGANYIPQNIKEGRYPNRWELDSISHGKNVLVMAATLHGCATNSEGLTVCQVPDGMPGVEGENGIQTGVFSSDESSFLATANILGSLTDDVLWGYIEDCCNNAVKKGVTSMHGLFGQFVAGDRDMDLISSRKELLPLEMVVFYQTWDVEEAIARGLPRVGGCLTLDGALFEYTMANFEPYTSAPALRGVLYHNDAEVYRVVSKAHAAGLQCSMHAVGERAIDQLIHIYRRVILEQGPKDLRHRIEHFCLPTDDQIALAKDLNLVLSMQPGFTYLWDRAEGGEFEYCLGRERANRWDPFHRIVRAGCTICGGSDCPVTPVEPLVDIASLVNGHNPIRNIPMEEALRMYTTNAAYAAGLEKSKGAIQLGMDGDFVILDRNPFDVAADDSIYELEAYMTIRDGKIVYKRNA